MAAQINSINDLQAELHTLKCLLRVAFFMARDLPYPEDADVARDHDDLLAVVEAVRDRVEDLDSSIDGNFKTLIKGEGK